MGRFLDQYLSTVGPMRKGLQSSNEEFLRTVNLPSRKQVTDLAAQVVSLDARLEALEERIEGLIESLSSIEAFVKRAGEPKAGPAPRQGKPASSPRGTSHKEA
jgi:hypothetical protein